MTFAVKVIFWGLIALDPQPSGQVTALLTESTDVYHEAQVYLLAGTCDDDTKNCFRGTSPGGPFGLVWFPDREELSITPEAKAGRLVHGARRTTLGQPQRFPGTLAESRDISWIPEMDIVTVDKRDLKARCLGDGQECPISARFIASHGDLSACHLLHRPMNQVEAFYFKPRGGSQVSDFNQAVADAAAEEFTVEGDSITLESRSFDKKNIAAAKLKPTKDGRLVLVVGNFPPNDEPDAGTAMAHAGPQGSHFTSFYRLLSDPPMREPFRHHTMDAQTADPGTCEPDLIDFEHKLLGFVYQLESELAAVRRAQGKSDLTLAKRLVTLRVRHVLTVPHLSTECDMVLLSP